MAVAYVAMGSNLGDSLSNLRAAARELEGEGTELRRSRIYRTDPVGGPAGQPPYLNAVLGVAFGTSHVDPRRLLSLLLDIEARHGRERRVRWEARTLDLDLISVGDLVLDEPDLTLPHPRMMERPFVLLPLLDVAPEWRHPATGERADYALTGLDLSGVFLTNLSWDV